MIEKFKENVILYDYIGEAIILFFSLLSAAVSLIIVPKEKKIAFYVALGLCLVELVIYALLSAFYFVGDEEERSTKKRIFLTMNLRSAFRLSALAFFITLLVAGYLGSSNAGWDGYLLTVSYAFGGLELLFFLYGIWKKAWIKENPERYSYLSISPKEPVPDSSKRKEHIEKEKKDDVPTIDYTKTTKPEPEEELLKITTRKKNKK